MRFGRSARFALILISAAGFNLNSLRAGFNPETGSYVFQHYAPKQYGALPQNWAIAQDRRGVMYFGNSDGLLEFDGTSWRLLRMANHSVVRSVSVDAQGTIYVGARGDFGLLRPDDSGTMQFVSLLNRVPEKERGFADVWRILTTPQGVYFSTVSRLFRLNPNGVIQSWQPEKRFGPAFYVLDTLYLQANGRGLLRMEGDQLQPVPNGERFASDTLYAAAETGDGALVAANSHLYHLGNAGISGPLPDDSQLAKSGLYSMKRLPGGLIALGTRNSGLFLLDETGKVIRGITKATDGLADDYIAAIETDRQGGIWLAQQTGLTRLNPGLSVFGKKDGIEGDVQCMTRHEGVVFVGTTTGLFRLVPAPYAVPRFERVEGISSTVFALVSAGADLLAAGELGGVFQVKGKKASLIAASKQAVFYLARGVSDPDSIYVARRYSVLKLRRKGAGWEQAADFPEAAEEFRSVEEDPDGQVWAASKGAIWRIDYGATPVRAEKFGDSRGVPPGWVNIRSINGHLTFATTRGLKKFHEQTKSFVPDSSLGSQFADGKRDVFNFFEEASGNVWVTGENYHGLLLKSDAGYRLLPSPLLRTGIQEIYWMSLDADGAAWVVGSDFVLHRFERGLYGDPDQGFEVLTRDARVIGASTALYGGAGELTALSLPWSRNKLSFEFAAPFYEDPAAVEYQVKLTGSDSDWSPWSHATKKDYTYLPEGSYQLAVRARSPHGTVSEHASVAFGVLPPWYRTWWAYSVYLVFFGFGVYGIVRWRTKKLEDEKKQLEIIVEERTVEIRQQRDEIHVQERKSHSLLLNILPSAVADELKATGAVAPVGFDDVTVCFTDFVGFTLSSEKLPPDRLVDALNEYFTAFDEISSRYGLEKLKTIGDSYMMVSGLPVRRKSHAVDAVLAAMEMVEVVKRLAQTPNTTGWNIRVGLHSGPVVAGVVGTRKFAFDIWGNTVNFAARMESSGKPGFVNMSERTQSLLQGLIETEFRGNVKIKEGRELPMYLAVGPAGDFEEFRRRYKEIFGEEIRSFPAMQTLEI